ncbi:cytochrome P450 [Corallococcus praedator]|uniref:Cytochrome P450 n=1 Tax=Corallococcus praedator TaxID=2316724 RepID=A0ABX9QSW7_9BACT|nr:MULTISPECIES: cytochrome P450 [Corallococcus]RKH21849.1 cytochrome P450 [Corallococcus sp. CA047B]RKH36478.1 cytochrome P450 [Corallococcus sp. CA031C]RKI16313.1 cytochrome P450 [Corallococcus praedator]
MKCPHLGAQYNPFSGPHVEDPHPFYAELRRDAPVSFNPMLGMWLVSRYDDICHVLKDPARFSSADMGNVGSVLAPETLAVLAEGYPLADSLLNSDPPTHNRLRKLMGRGFSAQRIAAQEGPIRAVAQELVDAFVHQGKADLVTQLAYPLPVRVILGMVGVPKEDMANIKHWCDDFFRMIFTRVPAEEQPPLARSWVTFQHYVARLIAARRYEPSDDLASYLVTTDTDGEALTLPELIIAIAGSLLAAGHETTTALLAQCWKQALLQPGLWQRLREDRSLVPHLIEETLRFDSVSHGMIRTTTEEVQLAGVTLPAGSRLLLLYASGSRDPALLADGDRFDISRHHPSHLGFGRGIHFCIGAPLARQEALIATNLLLDQLPDMRLAPNPDFGTMQNLTIRAIQHLPVEWTPRNG